MKYEFMIPLVAFLGSSIKLIFSLSSLGYGVIIPMLVLMINSAGILFCIQQLFKEKKQDKKDEQ